MSTLFKEMKDNGEDRHDYENRYQSLKSYNGKNERQKLLKGCRRTVKR